MPKYAANLSMLWPELDVYDRFAAAAAAGFRRIEILFIHALDQARLAGPAAGARPGAGAVRSRGRATGRR